ncbi:MAG: NAD(P)-binding protein [Ferruginibacter sp.]|nr:NAD(P)-binding protein [Rhodoferax sp.]
MTQAAAWDVLIVGGGLGGLSLAAELAQPQYAHLRVLVLEKRTRYQRDRTWSYWGTHRHRYTDLERHRWHRWSVRFEGRQCLQTSDIPYCTVDADAFYGAAVAQIAAATHVQLRMDCAVRAVNSPHTGDALLDVQLEDGSRESARWVMDARPAGKSGDAGLFQHFVGWEIRTPTDCFDDTLVELMDFQPACAGLHFFYVLPYGPRHALVETTWISTLGVPPDYEDELRAYLATRYGLGPFECIYQERGQLALQAEPQPTAHPRIVRVGQAAGTLRPSTGFAFLETLADARRLARCLGQAGSQTRAIASFRRKTLNRWMDRVFFQALASRWPVAPRYFLALFGGTTARTLVPFLAGNATLWQRLKVVMQLPKADFLRAAWQCVVG